MNRTLIRGEIIKSLHDRDLKFHEGTGSGKASISDLCAELKFAEEYLKSECVYLYNRNYINCDKGTKPWQYYASPHTTIAFEEKTFPNQDKDERRYKASIIREWLTIGISLAAIVISIIALYK